MASAIPNGVDVMAMCQALAESGGEFAKQFDRNDPEFHGDIKPAVPLGGASVPESMGGAAAANWRDLPEVQATIEPEYGPEYHALMDTYERINRCKKAISVLNKPVENAMKVRLQYKDAQGDDRTACESRLKGEEAKRDGALDAAAVIIDSIDMSLLSERTRSCVAEVVSQGKYSFEDKDTFGDYMLVLQRCNQAMFADQKKLLQKIKDIKKAANTAAAPVAKVATPARCSGATAEDGAASPATSEGPVAS
mmetsp:Transcript_63376/g.136319  ORF Transcript_63376/g.136319 Transcript_63376/m.136319 type:complete len:251 (-) Transcript_63376:81-833(-)